MSLGTDLDTEQIIAILLLIIMVLSSVGYALTV